MATKTTNYNLIKPELTDDADIRVINGNMDVLDNQLKSISDKASAATNNSYVTITVSPDYTWKFTKGSGENVSYDTIKDATTATAMSASAGTYTPNINASKYSQLEYWYGTQPYKGSTTDTTDSGILKFNHLGATAWNSAFVPNNKSSKRPYMAYQDGTAGDYSVFKDLAWYDDTTNKLPLAGGTMTGALKTTDNIYKTTNNGVLVLSGSTDASHGGRINLSGEQQSGNVKITADNGTNTNAFEVTPIGCVLNGINMLANTATDVWNIGSPSSPHLALNKDGDLVVDKFGDGTYRPVLTRYAYNGSWIGAWIYETNDLLIQGGVAIVGETMTNFTLPRPYNHRDSYILYASDNNDKGTCSDWAVGCRRVSNTTFALRYFADRQVAWLTIGGRN